MDKQGVLEHLVEARAALLAAIDGLGEAEMTTLPVAGDWTIKDILAHVSGWAAWDLAGVRGVLAGQRPDFSAIQDVDAFNARLVAERREWTLGRILAEMAEAHVALLDSKKCLIFHSHGVDRNVLQYDLFARGHRVTTL